MYFACSSFSSNPSSSQPLSCSLTIIIQSSPSCVCCCFPFILFNLLISHFFIFCPPFSSLNSPPLFFSHHSAFLSRACHICTPSCHHYLHYSLCSLKQSLLLLRVNPNEATIQSNIHNAPYIVTPNGWVCICVCIVITVWFCSHVSCLYVWKDCLARRG